MKFGTFAATTLMVVTAMGTAAGIVNAKPSEGPEENTTSGVDQGVRYETTVSDYSRKITTVVDGGTFEVARDGTTVSLKSDSGETVAEVPLIYEVSGARLPVVPEISDNGRKLALTPKVGAKEIGEMQPISSMNRLISELNKNVVGIVVGALLGGLLGAVIGLGFLSIITGPIGLIVGGLAGGAIMGGQSFNDAVMAVVTGEP